MVPSPNSSSIQPNIIVETPARKQKAFSTLIHPLHASLCSLRSATLFSNPIREQDAPGYSSLVLKPTDLKTIWKQVKEGIITESVVFHREVARMFANAIVYNAENCNTPGSKLQD
jgi:bromodomain-containing protein 8